MARWKKPPTGVLTPHFTWHEAVCNHCGRVVEWGLVRETAEWLEVVRERLGGDVMRINSWCRCPYWNAFVGGASASQHLNGAAIDFVHNTLSIRETQRRCRELWDAGLIGGLGIYKSWTHIDHGPKRRWNGP